MVFMAPPAALSSGESNRLQRPLNRAVNSHKYPPVFLYLLPLNRILKPQTKPQNLVPVNLSTPVSITAKASI